MAIPLIDVYINSIIKYIILLKETAQNAVSFFYIKNYIVFTITL